MRSRELAWLTVAVFALSVWANASFFIQGPGVHRFFPPFVSDLDANENTLLGAEYFCIGNALARGEGFGDTFGVGTGPTAWMPPVYPLLLAALIKLSWWHPPLVIAAVVLLKNLVLILTGMTVLWAAEGTARALRPRVALGLYGVWLVAHFWWFFQTNHDTWLILLLVDVMLLAAWSWLPRRRNAPGFTLWGLFGGLVFLTSPVAGLVWIAVTTISLWRTRRVGLTLASIGIAALLCSVWVVRNHTVFDRWIFVKSNLFYDLHSANYVSEDGVYDEDFFIEHHPFAKALLGQPLVYAELGEVRFLEQARRDFLTSFSEHPEVYFAKLGNRLLSATVRHKVYNQDEGRWPVVLKILRPLPLLGLVMLLAVRRLQIGYFPLVALVVYVTHLLPYIGVAFYTRYLLPLTPVLVLFMFWGVDAGVERLRRRG